MDTGIANVEQAEAWDGDEGTHWAQHADRYDASVHAYHAILSDRADLRGDDRVLDIGCGSGATTIQAARAAPDGSALGVDLSGPMLERARSRAATAGITNVRFERGDAQVHPFEPGAHDTLISRFGVMFFADPVAAFTNLRGAIRPGGRLVLCVWRDPGRNEWLSWIRDSLAAGRDIPGPPVGVPGPFGLADAGAVRAILLGAGWAQPALEPVDGPFRLGADADDAFGFVRNLGLTRGLLADLDEATGAAALDRLHDALMAHATPAGVIFESAAWIITATRPADSQGPA